MGKYVIPACEYCYLKKYEVIKYINEDGSSHVGVVCYFELKDKDKRPLSHMGIVTKVEHKVIESEGLISDADIKAKASTIQNKVDSLTAAAKLEYAGYDVKAK